MPPRVDDVAAARRALTERLFPEGFPPLWCPTLTHFAAKGRLDGTRIRRHLRRLAPAVGGVLVPGSTGEGWDLSDAEVRRLLGIVLDAVPDLGLRVLVGILEARVDTAIDRMTAIASWLRRRTKAPSPQDALVLSRVAGFTVCPPAGRGLAQARIHRDLERALSTGLPIALYQLPQVTKNEMSAATVRSLAARFPNFILLKDTSGNDRVARSGADLGGVFLVRGAEGGYARWPKTAGGAYDGFLLSTANVFAAELRGVLDLVEEGHSVAAKELSLRVENAVRGAFELVEGLSGSNPFACANKLLDHVLAHGSEAARVEPPLLHDGTRLPAKLVAPTMDLLRKGGFLPERGYLYQP